ncbi:hypothetical protein EPUL_004654, partial [Erysiphe pulchra]
SIYVYQNLISKSRVDFVIRYSIVNTTKSEAETQFVKLIEALRAVGLSTQVRYGSSTYILIFIRDWLIDANNTPTPSSIHMNFQENLITEAERLRLVHTLITSPISEGGVGLTPKSNEWKNVVDIFPLHNNTFNKKLLGKLGSKYFLDTKNLDELKDQFGEKIALYFAFVQSYFLFLAFPAGFGFFAWLFLGQYSSIYALFNGLWCIVFVEYWRKKQKKLISKWGSKNNYEYRYQTPRFQDESTINDSLLREKFQFFSSIKRLAKQFLQIPFVLAAVTALGGLIAICFGIEVFISEIYDGSYKKFLVLLPTVILAILMPAISNLLTKLASKLTHFEDYKTEDSHEASMIQKIFVLNFITSYFPIYLTAFVYVPFGQILLPYLNIFHQIIKSLAISNNQIVAKGIKFEINKDRLKSQVIYFTVTAQLINFGLELIVPFITRKISSKLKEIQASRTTKCQSRDEKVNDYADESMFLNQVRDEAEMKKYDVASDFREIVIQFGYLSLFSVVWPLTAVSFLVNNWIEIRGDAIKMAMESQRSLPWRSNSIGPWLDALDFLAWLGSLTSAAFIYLFSENRIDPDGTPWNIKGWGLLLTIFVFEHFFLATQLIVRKFLDKFDSSDHRVKKLEWLKIRKNYLMDQFSTEVNHNLSQKTCHKVNMDSWMLGNDAVKPKFAGNGPINFQFWQRHPSVDKIIENGKFYISRAN